MKKLLVVVDMQNDFVDGSLGTKEAQEIVSSVVEKCRMQEKKRQILFLQEIPIRQIICRLRKEKSFRWNIVYRVRMDGKLSMR